MFVFFVSTLRQRPGREAVLWRKQEGEIRRESMKSVLEEVHADKIAFAHHQGDNAETVLMNLCRGSQVKGMRGILPWQVSLSIHSCVWESQRSRRLFRNGACPGGLTLLISRMTTRETASETKLWGNFSKSIRQRGTYLPNGGKNVRVVGIYGR